MDFITFPENLQTTSGLLILLHGVISLPDTTSYDKNGQENNQNKDGSHYFLSTSNLEVTVLCFSNILT